MIRLIIAALAVAFSVSTAQAQQQCGPAATLAQHLADNFGERAVFTGTAADGNTVVFFVNDSTGSWTIAIVQGAVACLVASGQSAEMKPLGISL